MCGLVTHWASIVGIAADNPAADLYKNDERPP